MAVGQICSLPTPRSTVDKALFDQVWLVYLLHSPGILSYGSGYSTKPDGTSLELVDNGIEYLIIYRVKSALVYIKRVKSIGGYLKVYETGTLDLCEIPDPAQKRIGNTRCSTASHGYLHRGLAETLSDHFW